MWVTRYTYADFSKALISEVRSQYRSVSPVNYLLKNLNLLNIYRKILFKKMVNSPSTHHFVIEPLVSVIWHSLIPKDKIDRDASNTSSAQSKTVRWYPIQDLNISTPLSLIQGNMSSRKEKLNAMLGFLPLRKIYSSMCCIMTLILTLSRFLKWYLLQLSWIHAPLKFTGYRIAGANIFISHMALLSFCSLEEEILFQLLHYLSIPGVSWIWSRSWTKTVMENWFSVTEIPGAHTLDVPRLLRQPRPIEVEKVRALLFARHMQVVLDRDDQYGWWQQLLTFTEWVQCHVQHAQGFNMSPYHILTTPCDLKLLATQPHGWKNKGTVVTCPKFTGSWTQTCSFTEPMLFTTSVSCVRSQTQVSHHSTSHITLAKLLNITKPQFLHL